MSSTKKSAEFEGTGIDHGKLPPVINVEVYGFVLWIATIVSLVLFILWAFIPEPMLHSFGIHYYPSKYWAIALPAYISVAFISIYYFYISANLAATNPLNSALTLSDKWSKKMGQYQKRSVSDEYSIPDIYDISAEHINRMLFQSPQHSFAQQAHGLSRRAAFGSSANIRSMEF